MSNCLLLNKTWKTLYQWKYIDYLDAEEGMSVLAYKLAPDFHWTGSVALSAPGYGAK